LFHAGVNCCSPAVMPSWAAWLAKLQAFFTPSLFSTSG
jgi:hypothetical protein